VIQSTGMTARDILAALSVAIVWGLTFIAIKIGVGETTPLMLGACLRNRGLAGALRANRILLGHEQALSPLEDR
jgi:hypothetical protein